MRALFQNAWTVGALAIVGCTQTVTPPSLQSLAGSGQVSLLCRDDETGEGRDIRGCPDSEDATFDGEDRHTMALVTQTLRGEVAVVDLTTRTVLDADPWLPGKEFLSVGAQPTAIVSTPGGVASFVGVAEPGLEAIYALPTSCITAPPSAADEEEPSKRKSRELTLWSSCRLPGRPGKLAIIADPAPPVVDDANANADVDPKVVSGNFRYQCSQSPDDRWAPEKSGRSDDACPADLTVEERIAPAGRRKLLVTLPDLGLVAIYDAQAILNLDAGTFGDCVPDSVIALSSFVAPVPGSQDLPLDWPEAKRPDYKIDVPGGTETNLAGIALAEDKLYVADIGVPLVHVVDLSDPCKPSELEPLRPLDFDDPTRVVLSSEIAVSGPTVGGQAKHQRFLYAVDYDGPRTVDFDRIVTSRSIMAFDLSDGAPKTPIVRSHVPDLPFESPDRIRFESPVKRLQIVTHDVPTLDPATQMAQIGVQCDPYPDAEGVGTLYRTSSDFTKGAGPRKLRGIFGFATLATGQIAAIDIEDWDAPCRRPKSNNPNAGTTDWLGCTHDTNLSEKGQTWFSTDDRATVTDESSCNVFEPHRVRSGKFFRTDTTLGAQAPNLTTYPRLSSPETGDLPTGKSDLGLNNPQMLAVHFTDSATVCNDDVNPAESFLSVGTITYNQCRQGQNVIDTDPGAAEHNSLLLPLNEPRVYAPQESFSATYEGTVLSERTNGWLPRYAAAEAVERYGRALLEDEILLRDPQALFCTNGVEDYRITRETGASSFGLTDATQLDAFAAKHADFVTFTSDFDAADPYWAAATKSSSADSAYCPDVEDPYKSCVRWFGTKKDRKPARDFLVRESQNDDLVIVPREPGDPIEWVKRAHCCFRNVASYEVRAGQQWVVKGASLLTRMRGGDERTFCSKDTSVRRRKLRSRVFEIASSAPSCTVATADGASDTSSSNCAIGPVRTDDVDVCVTKDATRGVLPSEFTSGVIPPECLFDSLKGRFAIYRGRTPSERDMTFRWTVSGGFSPLSTTIASASVGFNVMPTDMVYSEAMKAFVIVDGSSGGLNLIDVATFSPLGQPFL